MTLCPGGRRETPCEQNDCQTPLKTLPSLAVSKYLVLTLVMIKRLFSAKTGDVLSYKSSVNSSFKVRDVDVELCS